ncbi:unnamed protein product [Thelazia callipaeda]|uniref:Lipase n=1 Tax=Thelazia callipaeda TaxID=103827 RepID=A0A0N5D3A0_THECL|nr:unnamed protein product [Thelazia callipaeda]
MNWQEVLHLLLISQVNLLVDAYFTKDFNKWLMEFYGPNTQATLNRADLGYAGSFGGKQYQNEMLRKQPVIFVHGVSNRAGDQPLLGAMHFRYSGYNWSELYATTYASGNQGNPLQWTQYSMKCQYVKQVRALIVAVRLYTGRAVDVIAFSLGVPIARKAVLGGDCVDTAEYLGRPLTHFVDTFVGIAGPNHGVSHQALFIGHLSIPSCIHGLLPICNTGDGLYSGACPVESAFLTNINSQQDYEGKHIFSIYSKADQWVGYNVCNKITAQIPGQHGEKVYDAKNHDETFEDSVEVQRQMILNHIVI